jgi:hypothetical protein
MPKFRILSWVLRWLVFWPVFVVLTLNIENAATGGGLADLIARQWGRVAPMIDAIYSVIASPFVLYPAIFLFGAWTYETFLYRLHSRERFDKTTISRATKFYAMSLVEAFKKKGFARWMLRAGRYGSIDVLNDRLKAEGLPPIPSVPFDEERVNRAFAQYLRIVSEGEREICGQYFSNVVLPTLDEVFPAPSKQGTEEETPR